MASHKSHKLSFFFTLLSFWSSNWIISNVVFQIIDSFFCSIKSTTDAFYWIFTSVTVFLGSRIYVSFILFLFLSNLSFCYVAVSKLYYIFYPHILVHHWISLSSILNSSSVIPKISISLRSITEALLVSFGIFFLCSSCVLVLLSMHLRRKPPSSLYNRCSLAWIEVHYLV